MIKIYNGNSSNNTINYSTFTNYNDINLYSKYKQLKFEHCQDFIFNIYLYDIYNHTSQITYDDRNNIIFNNGKYLQIDDLISLSNQFTFCFRFISSYPCKQQQIFYFNDNFHCCMNTFPYNNSIQLFYNNERLILQYEIPRIKFYNNVVVRYKNNKMQMFFNNMKTDKNIISFTIDSKLILGSNNCYQKCFDGYLKDVYIYSVYKSDKQIYDYLNQLIKI